MLELGLLCETVDLIFGFTPVVDRDDDELILAILVLAELLLERCEVGSLPTTWSSPDTPEVQIGDLPFDDLGELLLLAG